MKNMDKETKVIKVIFCVLSVITLIIGLTFSYLVAELDDAPGMILIGTTFTLVSVSFIYGYGEILIMLKRNNALLSDIHNELKNKNK